MTPSANVGQPADNVSGDPIRHPHSIRFTDFDAAAACPACEQNEHHAHRTRRSPTAPSRQVQVLGRRTSLRPGAPSLSDALLAALVALADVLVLGLLALLVMP